MMKSEKISFLLKLCMVMMSVLLVFCGCATKSTEEESVETVEEKKDITEYTHIVYEAKEEITEEEAKEIVGIMKQRLGNIDDFRIGYAADRRFVVEIPRFEEFGKVVDVLGMTAKLSFVDSQGKVILESENVNKASAQATNDQYTNKTTYVVSLKFDKEGTKKFADATSANVGQPIYIYMDYEDPENASLLSAPVVHEAITGGECQITGDFTMEGAQNLALLINSGCLPVELEMVSIFDIKYFD